ncbi:hypothetical protein OAS06_00155 [Gammaproteobacteria bacterium]|nr:hypothetical protein [Gammaproteobacteria bacterium]
MAISRSDGFVDLRVSPSGGGRANEDSVWPSFTDIMTVVVLIFLVSLVVIMMRNTELVAQLSDSVSQNEMISNQRSDFELRIASMGDELVQLRALLDQTDSQRKSAEQDAEQKQIEILALLSDISDLSKARDVLAQDKAALSAELGDVNAEKLALLSDQQQMRTEIAALQDDKRMLAQDKAALSAELGDVNAEKLALLSDQQQMRTEIAALQDDKRMLAQDKAALSAELGDVNAEKLALLSDQQQMRTEIAALQDDKRMLAQDKAALNVNLATAVSGSNERLDQLQLSERLREELSADLSRLQSVLAQLQAEQIRLTATLQTSTEEKDIVTMSRDELAAERDQLAQQVSALDVTRISLQTEIGALREELASFVRTAVSSERALEESEVMAETLTRELAAVSLEYRLTKEELAFLQAELADEVASFKKERDLLIAAHTEELDILRDQHSDLESRYNRLVRPARSTVGRVVVEVRFWKDGAVRQYSLRESGGSEEIISESDLYQKLSVLKVKHADKLYTKVIPDDNSLTHGEAWGFTNKILNRFDYYYQN